MFFNFSYFKLLLNYLEIFYIGLLFSRIYNKTDSLSAVFLCIAKPANITFKILFSAYQVKPESEQEDDNSTKTKNGAGALVGILERFLCAVFIVLGQYSAVGLTMTAKSIARYDQITKNPAFAEYYLIGTLYSILYTVVLYGIIFKYILY